jgi:hypothetical protein
VPLARAAFTSFIVSCELGGDARIRRRSPTSNDACKKARHDAKQTAASSATSPATSTASSNTERHRRLDRHRSITRARGAAAARSGLGSGQVARQERVDQASVRCRSNTRYERRCPSRRKPAFSKTRCEAMLSRTTSASTRATGASVTAHRARRPTAREPNPRPRPMLTKFRSISGARTPANREVVFRFVS